MSSPTPPLLGIGWDYCVFCQNYTPYKWGFCNCNCNKYKYLIVISKMADTGDVKQLLVCLGKCNRPIKFTSDETQSDKEVLKKHISEEFQDCLPNCHCDMILQVKDEEWNQFFEIQDKGIGNRAVLQVFLEV